ncbi:hypothetical protein MJH12_09575 [bacterium]|nr:hypothetical protein [bacterium]
MDLHKTYKIDTELPSSIREEITSYAKQKDLAAQNRLRAVPENVERSTEVYHNSCKKIGDILSKYGFKFSKSSLHCSRKFGEFKNWICFMSNMNNVSGQLVEVSCFYYVTSAKYKKWQLVNGNPDAIGELFTSNPGRDSGIYRDFKWNLANPETRNEKISGIVKSIEDFGLTFFDRFNDLDRVCNELVEGSYFDWHEHSNVEPSLFLFNKTIATKVVLKWRNANPRFIYNFVESYEEPKPLDTQFSSQNKGGSCLGRLCKYYDIDVISLISK